MPCNPIRLDMKPVSAGIAETVYLAPVGNQGDRIAPASIVDGLKAFKNNRGAETLKYR